MYMCDYSLQHSCLENPMDRGAWQATVHGVTRVGHDLVTKPPPPPLENSQVYENPGPAFYLYSSAIPVHKHGAATFQPARDSEFNRISST